MLGTAIPSIPATAPTSTSPTLHTSTSSATPTSPTRSSRLRGFTYLRNYAQEHLPTLARNPENPSVLTRSQSSPGTATPETLPPLPAPRERLRQVTRDDSSTPQNSSEGWLPTVHGRSDSERESLHPSLSPESASPERSMTRNRTAGASAGPTRALARSRQLSAQHGSETPQRSNTMPSAAVPSTNQTAQSTAAESSRSKSSDQMPTIRFIPHTETRSSRPSLQFTAISRTLATSSSVVRVGRFSERDNPNAPTSTSTTPVGFKSKVVSRRHCEFWCSNGQWYVKDVRSSSGTFLNHVRLSSPGIESKPFPVNDGDVVQLGIDFKGGEEVIFRCVKIRIECNRGWQKSLNNFNTSAHKKLFKSTSRNGKEKNGARQSDAASTNTSECSICLNPVAPCQALFVAPCGHVWHWKCIKKVVDGPAYPHFICPNCRFVADLDADVEPPEDFGDYWPEKDLVQEEEGGAPQDEPRDDDEHDSDEEEDSSDGVARLTPSREDADEDREDETQQPLFEPVSTSHPIPRSPSPPTSLPPIEGIHRTNPFVAISPTTPSPSPYKPDLAAEGARSREASGSAVSGPMPIASGTDRGASERWRSDSGEDLTEQARSPTPTNTAAFALTAQLETQGGRD